MIKNLRFMLLGLLAMVCGSIYAQGLSENFENLTLTDASGNALANSWSYGYGLSNGWKIVGGSIFGSAGTTNYGYVKSTGSGHDGSNGYLEASYSSSNTASVWVSQPMPSDVATFWVKSTSTRNNGKVIIYEANADGSVTTTKLLEEQVTAGQAWTQKSVTGVSGKYIAINLVRTQFDDFECTSTVVEQKADLHITAANPAATVNMTTGGTTYVSFKNNGAVDAQNVVLSLYVDGAVNNTVAVGTLKANGTGFKGIAYAMDGITEGDHQVYLTLTADNDDTEGQGLKQTVATTVNFYTPVVAPTFSVTAENVTVPYGAESFQLKAVVKNTNGVASENVSVKLTEGITQVGEVQTITSLAANGEQEVTFTVAGPFMPGQKTYAVYVNNVAIKTDITVTFEAAPVASVVDLAVTGIQGTIDQAQESSSVTVLVENLGNVDITAATITLKAGQTVLGTGTLFSTVRAVADANTGFSTIAVGKDVAATLTAGTLDVTATAVVEGEDADKLANNTLAGTITVKAVPAAEAAYSVTAENVTVAYGATSFEVKAVVKNTSEVAAQNVEVKLLKQATTVDTKTIASLPAGAEQTVTFTVTEMGEAGTTTTYYVQVASKAQAEVIVTFAEQEVAPVVDMELYQIQGVSQINLKEENQVQVWYRNNGNVATTATISATLNGTALEAQTVEGVKAAGQGYVFFTLPTEGLTAGQTATFVATIAAEGDTNADNNQQTRSLPIVSGEAASQADIALNGISGWTVEPGEQTVSLSVGVFNNGEADAENVVLNVYKDYPTVLATKTIEKLEAGQGTIVTFDAFSYTFETGRDYEFTVQTLYADADVSNNTQRFTISCKAPVADLGLAKIASVSATTEEDVKIVAVVKNHSAIDATEAKVGVYTQGDDFQYQIVGIQKSVDVAAQGEASVEFNLGKLAAGTYRYYVRIVTTDDNMENNMQDVTVKVSEPVDPVVSVGITGIQGISNIDLAAQSNTVAVWVANEGNVDCEAAQVTVQLNNTTLDAQTIAVTAGKSAYASFTLPTEGLVAGTKATVKAVVSTEGNTSSATELTREYDVIDSSVATEPVFAVTADAVEVEQGAETLTVVATVKNTSSVAATGVEVKLFYNSVIATQTIESLAAGAETTVTFADVQNPFTKAGSYTMYVMAPKAQAEVAVTVKEPYVEPVYDLAVTLIQGSLNLAYESGNISVQVENHGNQDMKDATVRLTVDETEYTKAVSVKAGEDAWALFTVATEGLTAGTVYTFAQVEVENDATPADNKLSANITVTGVAAEQPTFSVTAENVSVPVGAEKFNIVAKVKNTSTVDATQVKVVLMKGINEVESKTIATLAGGAEKEVTFYDIEDILEPGKTATYFVQVASSVQAEVTVTFEQPVVDKTVDLAVTSINGTLSASVETNYLTVYVENKGTADVTGATVTLTAGDEVLGTGVVSAKAGGNGFCSVAIPATALQSGDLTVTATVEAEGDTDLTNNTLTKTFSVALPDPSVEITVGDVTIARDVLTFNIPVRVRNLREDYAAKNVKVMIYDSNKLIGQATVETLAPAEEKTVDVTITVETPYTGETTLRAWATGYSETQTVEFKLIVDTITGISAVMEQLGDDAGIFTVDGKKLNTINRAGLYIVNGKKVVVK